ncbi:MAG: type II secretion system F family protein [Alphaproteobacteria bacterium]|nr:type II secretion system F family protein [Alphaproteobacteria bacterium]
MALYHYRAMNGAGAIIKGRHEAPSRDVLLNQLHGQGLYLLAAAERGARGRLGDLLQRYLSRDAFPAAALATAMQELAMLLKAGLDLDRALAILVGLSDIGRLKEPLTAVRERVRKGTTFAGALGADARFPRFYISMIRAGEAGGTLGESLQQLSDYIARSLAIRETILSALIYPCLLLLTAGGSVLLIMVFVLPEFESLFAEAGKSLPLPTRIVLDVGAVVRMYGWIMVLGAVAFTVWFRHGLRGPEFRYKVDASLIRLPVLGPLMVSIEIERLMRTFGMLLQSGVPVPSALAMSKEVVGNTVLARALGEAATGLREGERLAQRLDRTGLFPGMAVDLVRIGEESGKLDDMLLRQADLDAVRIKHKVDRLLALLVPVLTIVLGLIVAGLIASLLVAILSVNELAQQ